MRWAIIAYLAVGMFCAGLADAVHLKRCPQDADAYLPGEWIEVVLVYPAAIVSVAISGPIPEPKCRVTP